MHEAHPHRRHTAQAEGAVADFVLAAGDPKRCLVLVLDVLYWSMSCAGPGPSSSRTRRCMQAIRHRDGRHRDVQPVEEARIARLVDEPVVSDMRQRPLSPR